ncbi:FANCI solenoid 4-domain-containing protein [Pilobolus umbonatus]|nr:FANCI solenoid 4-domain-containing protein [Pilobolus umbonatus]
MIRAILMGSPVEGGIACIQRRYTVIKSIIEWLNVDDITALSTTQTQIVSNVVNLILSEIELLQVSMLHELGVYITSIIHQKKVIHIRLLDVLSKVWNALYSKEKGSELEEILNGLLEADWQHQTAISIASVLNDMELSKSHLERTVRYMIMKISDLEIEEVPPFVYQLLLISRKGYKRIIISGIFAYFNQLSIDNEELNRIQGTVMLHISFAIKQDQDLGNELIKLMKTNKSIQMEVFDIACLLSIARIHRFQETIFDIFRTSIITFHKDNDKIHKNVWISKYYAPDTIKFTHNIISIADKSVLGWDQVIQSLTQLSLILIDTAANQGAFGKTSTCKLSKISPVKNTPMDHVANLGIEILLRMFKHHDIIRTEILEQITSRIISRSPSSSHFLLLLKKIIENNPNTIEKHLSYIKDTLDYLSFLPTPIALTLLEAIQPILKINDQFRNGLILILRKSLFAKDINGRGVAINGFLGILYRLLETQQENEDELSSVQSNIFEILGLLRRCFSQQTEIRITAYNGLGSLASQFPLFAADIFELLYIQFIRLYEKDINILCPLRVDSCVESANNSAHPKITEPVHILLINLVKCVHAIPQNGLTTVVEEAMVDFRDIMKSIITRLSKAELEDFDLDKTANFDITTHMGIRNYHLTTLLLGIYEAAFEYEFHMHGVTREASELLLQLFKRRKTLLGLLKDFVGLEKSKSNPNNFKSVITSDLIIGLIKHLFKQRNGVSEPIRNLQSDIDLIQYIVNSSYDGIAFAIEDEYCDHSKKTFDYCVKTCQVYMQILMTEDSDSIYLNGQAKNAMSVISSMAHSLWKIFELVSNVWPDQFDQFFSQLVPADNGHRSKNGVLIKVIVYFKEIILNLLSSNPPNYKEATHVMQIVILLSKKLDRSHPDFTNDAMVIFRWLQGIAKERPIQDEPLAKEIIFLLIHISADINEFETIQHIAVDIHKLGGELNALVSPDEEEYETQYEIINVKTLYVIMSQVFDFLDSSSDDLIWCINKLKYYEGTDGLNVTMFESDLCNRLMSQLIILSELIKSVPHATHAENLFKALVKVYRVLTNLVKYKTSAAHDIADEFKNVVSIAGNSITDRMYSFLTLYNQKQQDDDNNKKKGKKRKEVDRKKKARVLRESKMIPNVIFMVEQFERHLIQLSRKSKVDLMQFMKRSTSRDFRIQLEWLNEDSSDEEEKESMEEDVPMKRLRIQDE